MRLADIEDEQVVAAVEPFFQLFNLDIGSRYLGFRLLAPNAAELLVIDKLRDRRMRAACRAIGIFPQFEFAEFHAEGIDQQQPADERVALTEDQLDGLGSLNHPDQAR